MNDNNIKTPLSNKTHTVLFWSSVLIFGTLGFMGLFMEIHGYLSSEEFDKYIKLAGGCLWLFIGVLAILYGETQTPGGPIVFNDNPFAYCAVIATHLIGSIFMILLSLRIV